MKFLCPSCKAKYQIADEKVAGRSVRMKCRKCGHLIHVSSDDAISGSSVPPPDDSSTEEAEAAPVPKAEPSPRAPLGVPRAAPSATAAKPPTSRLGQAPPAPAKSNVPVPKPATPFGASRPVAPPRAAAPPVTRPTAAKEAGTAKSAAELAPLPRSFGVVSDSKLRDEGDEEATQIARGALIGAFSAAMHDHAPASVADPLSMPGDEWFVGINGVPVGPIRLAELRAKAGSGAITKESLVWRDGFEEWRPLKSFPELIAIVEESLSSARASMPFPTPGAAVGVIAGALADPFAQPAPQPTFAPGSGTGSATVTEDLDPLRRRPRTSPAAWLAVVMAMLFGITLGFVFFGRNAAAPEEKADKPGSVAPVAVPSAAPSAAAEATEKAEESHNSAGETKVGSRSSGTRATAPKTETDSKPSSGKGLGLSGLSANGTKGPSETGGSSTPSSGSGGGQLDQAQLTGVVSRYTPSVKRSCWQPALDGRDKDAPTSARVSVAITIGPSGSVQDVSTGGDPRGYRGLAQCIAGRVRGWQFPPSGGTTTVNVPFVFVAQ
jgi:predicted Zn finger-like uncharacterized protein